MANIPVGDTKISLTPTVRQSVVELLNQTLALRQKSGMGHYVAHLVRCLAAHVGAEDQLSLYPGRWTQTGLAGWQRISGVLTRIKKRWGQKKPGEGGGNDRLNAWGRRLLNWHFQAFGAYSHFRF